MPCHHEGTVWEVHTLTDDPDEGWECTRCGKRWNGEPDDDCLNERVQHPLSARLWDDRQRRERQAQRIPAQRRDSPSGSSPPG